MSGLASLFYQMATAGLQEGRLTCPECESENIIEVDHAYGICQCADCETRFERPPAGESTAVDRGGSCPVR